MNTQVVHQEENLLENSLDKNMRKELGKIAEEEIKN
jgi:hypothetical protein